MANWDQPVLQSPSVGLVCDNTSWLGPALCHKAYAHVALMGDCLYKSAAACAPPLTVLAAVKPAEADTLVGAAQGGCARGA